MYSAGPSVDTKIRPLSLFAQSTTPICRVIRSRSAANRLGVLFHRLGEADHTASALNEGMVHHVEMLSLPGEIELPRRLFSEAQQFCVSPRLARTIRGLSPSLSRR